MKKILKVLFIIISIIFGLLLWSELSRDFYCLEKDKCITVWKTSWGCYIIPGKYYGLISPSDDYIKTTNTQYLTIYFSDEMPKTLIIRNEGTSQGFEGGYTIFNNAKEANFFNLAVHLPGYLNWGGAPMVAAMAAEVKIVFSSPLTLGGTALSADQKNNFIELYHHLAAAMGTHNILLFN